VLSQIYCVLSQRQKIYVARDMQLCLGFVFQVRLDLKVCRSVCNYKCVPWLYTHVYKEMRAYVE